MTPPNSSWYRTFLIIFAGQAFSLLGSAAVNFALVWWLAAKTGSAAVLAYASIAATLPQALVTPLAGPLVDRWDRRQTMIWADLFIAATSVLLIVVFLPGDPSVWAVYILIAARSVGTAFHAPASQAAVPMYVPRDQLMRVAGWNFFLVSGVAMAGPVLGALLMGAAPVPAVFAVDIAGALLAVGSLLLVRIPQPIRHGRDTERTGLIADFLTGWRELTTHTGLFALAIILTVVTILYMPINALFPLMTLEHFDGTALMASVIELAFGGGMLVASLAVGRLAARVSGPRLIGTGIVAVGILLAAAGVLPGSAFWAFAVLCVAMGCTVPLFSAPLTAMFQASIEPSRLGRVLSLLTTMSMLVVPVGLLLAGPAAEATGVARWFLISGLAIALAGSAVFLVPSIRALGEAGGQVPNAEPAGAEAACDEGTGEA